MAMCRDGEFTRYIHDITNAQFRSKFDSDLARMRGMMGIGVISDYEDQPLIIRSHLGVYAIVTVGVVKNADELVNEAFGRWTAHFSEMSGSERMFTYGAKEVHMRPSCPPLLYGCKFLNFSRSRPQLDLAGHRAAVELEGDREPESFDDYANPDSSKHYAMVDPIRKEIGLTTLQYQRLDDMVEAIGMPMEKCCTYCWNGREIKD